MLFPREQVTGDAARQPAQAREYQAAHHKLNGPTKKVKDETQDEQNSQGIAQPIKQVAQPL